jgi:hypothetical protein
MSWIDILENHQFLKTLFPNTAPSLDGIRLHEVRLHQDGPIVGLSFDLTEYPAQAPAKWQAAGSNTVQVSLMGIGVKELVIRGWDCNNVGCLVIRESANGVAVDFEAALSKIGAIFESLRVDRVTAYRDETYK